MIIAKFPLGIWTRFKCYIWDKNWLRNSLLFIVAALIVHCVFINLNFGKENSQLALDKVDKESITNLFDLIYATSQLFNLAKWLGVTIFCSIIILLFWVSIKLAKIKGIKIFILSFLAFLAARYWSEITSKLINVTNNLTEQYSESPNWNVILNFANILHLMAAILLGVLLYLFIRFLSHSGGIDILPFENVDSDSKNELVKGLAISDALASELHRIYDIYTYNEDVKLHSPTLRGSKESTELLKLRLCKRENLEVAFSQVGSIPITDKATLQIGAILFAIRQLWPSGSSQVITGSICSCNSKKRLFARYEEANHTSKIHAYTVTQEEVEEVEQEQEKNIWHDKSDNLVPKMVKSLASKIAVDSSPKIFSTSDWVAFQSFTEALFHFYRYEKMASKKSQDFIAELDTVFNLCQRAIERDKGYKTVSDLLSEISVSYLNHAELGKAESARALAMEINPNNSHVHSTYGDYCYLLGDNHEAKDYYEYAKELDPNDPKIYLRIGAVHLVDTSHYSAENPENILDFDEARKNFWSALDLDPRNNTAKSLLAWLDFLCYLEELKKESKTAKNLHTYLYLACVLENLPEKLIRIPWRLFFYGGKYTQTTTNFPTIKLCLKQASRKLDDAIKRLKRIPQTKKNYIDYSNLAIFLLYKKHKGYEEEVQLNWWKARQLCSGNRLDSNQPIDNKLHYIFYNFLTLTSSEEILENIYDLKQLLGQIDGKRNYYKRFIDNLLIDAKIILVNCIDGSNDWSNDDKNKWNNFNKKFEFIFGIDSIKPPMDISNCFSKEKNEFPWRIGRAMQEFIKTLDPKSLQYPKQQKIIILL